MSDTDHLANRLSRETSPYLLQHASNPVDWYPWGDEAFEAARDRDRPLLLSVGYSACHWCHVMERESFSDAETAGLMNRLFVCVKVDREERPDVDALYMRATQAMAGHGGWPMTVFLTPQGRPFYAGTYFPPEPRHGMPAFRRVLVAVADAWDRQRSDIEEQGDLLVRDLTRGIEGAGPSMAPSEAVAARAEAAMERSFDARLGGFGGPPMFPQPMALDFLLRFGKRTGRIVPVEMALRALGAMAAGGIHDHVGGGFHRYAVDERWLVPHFEKMLYDNAQLATVYLRAWQATGNTDWRDVAARTLDFVRIHMTLPSGGFLSSYDADSEGGEGVFYTWTPGEVGAVLGGEAGDACRRLGIIPEGHMDGRSVVHLPEGDVAPTDEVRSWLDALAAARLHRSPPAADEKVLASWNGLMLSAFAEAAMLTGRADYLQTAVNNGEFLLRELCERDGQGRLNVLHSGIEIAHENPVHRSAIARTFRRSGVDGFLDDHALVAEGFADLYEATGEARWLSACRDIADRMFAVFAGEGPLLRMAPPDACTLFANPTPTEDNAVPSGNAVAAEVALRLSSVVGEPRYAQWAQQAMSAIAALAGQHPLAFARWLCALERYLGPNATVVVAGDRDDDRTQALLSVAHRSRRPGIAVVWADPGAGPSHPAVAVTADRIPVNGRPAAYVCVHGACRAPITDAPELARALDETT